LDGSLGGQASRRCGWGLGCLNWYCGRNHGARLALLGNLIGDGY